MNCSNGIAGVEHEKGTVCCAKVCDFCGGSGCGFNASGTADDCCESNIIASGVHCDDGNEAPCILSIDSTSTNPTSTPTTAPSTPLPLNAPGGEILTFPPTLNPSVSEVEDSISNESIAAIAGGVVGVVLILVLTVTIVRLTRRHRQGIQL